MIEFLKKWKREIIRKKVYRLNVRAAKYLRISEAELKNSELAKQQLDYLNLNSGMIPTVNRIRKKYCKYLSKSAKYEAMYDNCQDQINVLQCKAIDLSVKTK